MKNRTLAAQSERPTVTRRRFFKVAAAGAAGTTLIACAPGAAAPAGDDTQDESSEDSSAQEDGASSGEATTLLVGWGGAPANLDPITASADVEINLLNAIYDYLIDTDDQATLVPRLAESWEVSDDGLTYTLNIVEGATWHDGDPLTLDDILWTIERLRDPEAATSDLFSAVEGVAAGDGNQIVFTLNATTPDFLFNLSDNRAVILKQNAENIGSDFNGTGPFRLVEFNPEDRATLEANGDYWGGAPAIDQLELVFFGDATAAANALRGGQIDVLLRMDNATFLGFADEGFTNVNIATNGHDLVRLRADREPGNDERVRMAFKMATDRATIFERVQLGFGAQGRDTPVGPLYGAYYTEDFELPEHDPEGARALLAEAGYEDGLDMTLFVPNLADRVALAEVLAAQWAEAGINITIEPQEEAVYYGDNGWLEVDLGITPWGSRPIPQFYLDVAYKTDAIWNEAHFSDAELDEQIDIAGSSVNPDERVAAYREIQRILIERGPVIIPYFFAQFGVFSDRVSGVNVHPFAGRTNLNTASIS
ncbi:MAG: ABC transporter substrate-binding protein [Chloroflexi bacterium]|nr:ABC transporter substrate-binding protein [Chloroflexota bacterium]